MDGQTDKQTNKQMEEMTKTIYPLTHLVQRGYNYTAATGVPRIVGKPFLLEQVCRGSCIPRKVPPPFESKFNANVINVQNSKSVTMTVGQQQHPYQVN